MNDLQNFPYLIVFITIFALASFTACEDNVSVQDAGPQVIEGGVYRHFSGAVGW